MEDDLNGRQPPWNTTSMEDKLIKKYIEDDLNRRKPQWETT